ncbi:MAG: DUF2226 domain-containing protein [Methanosarcinales archaeon]
MQIPYGKKVKMNLKEDLTKVIENLDSGFTGYIRVTNKNFDDFYIFFKDNKIVATYAEVNGKQILGEDLFSLISGEYIIDIFELKKRVLDIMINEYPDIRCDLTDATIDIVTTEKYKEYREKLLSDHGLSEPSVDNIKETLEKIGLSHLMD